MKNIEIYTQLGCRYCIHAKKLLNRHGLLFSEFSVTRDPDYLSELQRRTTNRTFPQIFIDNQSIGGFEELHALMLKQA